MIVTSASIQRILLKLLKVIIGGCWLVFFSVPMGLFASMQLSGLIPISIALVAVSIGYTSLLFNRARAHPKDRIGRRSLRAADQAFIGSILLLFTFVVGVSTGTALIANGYTERPFPMSINQLSKFDFLPNLIAVLLVGPAQFSAISFYHSVKTLVRRDFFCGPSRRWYLSMRREA